MVIFSPPPIDQYLSFNQRGSVVEQRFPHSVPVVMTCDITFKLDLMRQLFSGDLCVK